MRFLRKAICFLAVLCLITPCCASAVSVDQLRRSLLSDSFSAKEIRLTVRAERLSQFEEQRIDALGCLLRHLALRLKLDADSPGAALEVDGKTVASFRTRTGASGERERIWSFGEDGRMYLEKNPADAEDGLLTSLTDPDAVDRYVRIFRMLEELYPMLSRMDTAFPDQTTFSKANTAYRGYGKATRQSRVTLTEEALFSDAMKDWLNSPECPLAAPFLSAMQFSGRQKITLLKNDDGDLMKATWDGLASVGESALRTVSLNWRCLRRDDGFRDVLQLKTPIRNGGGRNNITLEREWTLDEAGGEKYTCEMTLDDLSDGAHTRTQLSMDFTSGKEDLSGKIQQRVTSGGVSQYTKIRLQLFSGAKGEEGTLEIERNLGTIKKDLLSVAFTVLPDAEQQAGEERTPAEASSDEIVARLSGALLHGLSAIPPEDLDYLLKELPDDFWNQLIHSDSIENEETVQP